MEPICLLSQASYPASGREELVAYVLLGGVVGYGIWRLFGGWSREPVGTDPWPPEVDEAISRDDAQPLCPACLEPQVGRVNFCVRCGTAVGEFVNLMPFERIFSEGHVLRLGTSGEFQRNWKTIGGYVVVALATYGFLAPIYWVQLIRNLCRQRPAKSSETDHQPDSADPVLPG